MPVPDYQSFMLPVLRFAELTPAAAIPVKVLVDAMAAEFRLSETDLREMLPSGTSTTLGSRVGWACTYLKKAGLLAAPKRSHIQITERGRDVLKTKPKTVNTEFLKRFPEFVAFQNKAKATSDTPTETPAAFSEQAPHDLIATGYKSLRAALAGDLLERVKSCTPGFFEVLVIELLLKMGYGGSRADAGKALGRTGDEGIDGIIKEDRLGLDTIYIQAKRWKENSVGRPAIQQFAGALAGQGAHKGIFITTSRFTDDARSFVAKVNSKIVLIDGEELAELMIDNGIGVSTAATYEVKRIDSDYFSDAEQ
jgi:restriction system protein